MIKKALLCAGLAFSLNSFAGGMGCDKGGCDDNTALDFGIEALYLKAQYNGGLAFRGFYSFPSNGGPTFFQTQYLEFNRDSQLGFALEGSYHPTATDDYNINWSHYKSKTDRTPFDGTALDNNTTPIVSLDSYTDLTSYWDQINLERGHQFSFLDFLVRVHGGANISMVKTKTFNNRFRRAQNDNIYQDTELKFTGVGPRLGLDGIYQVGSNFYLLAKAATSILVGDRKGSFFQTLPAIPNAGDNNNGSASQTALVPEVDGSIGAGVTFDSSNGRFSMELVYHGLMYFGVYQLRPLIPASPVVSSDMQIHGGGLKVHWVG